MKTKHFCNPVPLCSPWGRGWQVVYGKAPPLLKGALITVLITLLSLPTAALGKGEPGKGNRGSKKSAVEVLVDYGDVFGDLMHIYRHEVTGQPIFAQRWVELPAEIPGFGWGYCAMVFTDYLIQTDPDEPGYGTFILDEFGEKIPATSPMQIPYLPYSCDFDPAFNDPEMITEVDYFGRLNASRVQERNQRMHLNEVITNIQQADRLKLDPVGRLMLGYECAIDCLWSTIDSPMESMALYRRLMKYGHLGTDPGEVDLWWHGDPALYVDSYPVHPALSVDDYAKFLSAGLGHLLPNAAMACWSGLDWDVFDSECAEPEALTPSDFDSSAIYLGAAANKTGRVTVDLVQYLNRFLRITQTTDVAQATVNSLPALYLDCYDESELGPPEDPPEDGEIVEDLVYGECELIAVDADDPPPSYEYFSNIRERFMDFSYTDYRRESFLETAKADLILHSTPSALSFMFAAEVPLIDWVGIPNPLPQNPQGGIDYGVNINNFVIGANDTVRSVEYIHNYAVPVDLYCKYAPENPSLCLPVE